MPVHNMGSTHESTLEKSAEGDMTKLSPLSAHEMRCDILLSSSMLSACRLELAAVRRDNILGQVPV